MPYCRKCGNELKEGASFCPKCGAPTEVGAVTYRRPVARVWSIGRIVIVALGGIVLLVAFGLLIGGGGINAVRRNLSDKEGFLISGEADLQVDSTAIVGRGIDIEWAPRTTMWAPRPGDFVTVKIVAESNDPSKEVFIGIAQESYALDYLGDVWYHELEDLSWPSSPGRKESPEISFKVHPGESQAISPLVHSWWVAQATGPGIQELEWEPEAGNYWIVAMNTDGSAGLDLSARIGARVPILGIIESALLTGGFIALLIGGGLIYVGFYSRS